MKGGGESPKESGKKFLLLIILNGIAIRLALAYAFFGNFDMGSYEIVAEIVERGGNVCGNEQV